MVKILISGDVDGRLDLLYKRVSTLHSSPSHGPFDYLFCVGSFLPEMLPEDESLVSSVIEDYICGIKEAPLPTYFTKQLPKWLQNKYSMIPLKAKEELSSNIIFLGENGLHLVDKLTVGIYNGRGLKTEDKNEIKIQLQSATLRNSAYIGCDILLTDEWGQGIIDGLYGKDEILTNFYSTNSPTNPSSNERFAYIGDPDIAELAAFSRPRYHFASGEGVYYQRTPYLSLLTPPKPPVKFQNVTRFVGLGTVNNKRQISDKKLSKWLHALLIEPVSTMSAQSLYQASVDLELYDTNPYRPLIGNILEQTYCDHPTSSLSSHSTLESNRKRKLLPTSEKEDGEGPITARRFLLEEDPKKKQKQVIDKTRKYLTT